MKKKKQSYNLMLVTGNKNYFVLTSDVKRHKTF